MKKIFKSVVSLLTVASVLLTNVSAGGFDISADAANELKSSVSYNDDGTAVLTVEAGEWGNTVYYTLDGSLPDTDSYFYAKGIKITEKTTVRIAEFDENGKRVDGIKKTVVPKSAKVNIETYPDGDVTIVVMSCDTPDAEIYYTTDKSIPTEDDKLYEHPFVVRKDTRIRAKSFSEGRTSASASAVTAVVNGKSASTASVKPEDKIPEIDEKEEEEQEETRKPEKEVVDNDEILSNDKVGYKLTYMDDVEKTYVTLNKSKASNYFRYTTDGTTPTNKNGKKYSSRITFTEPGVLRVREYNTKGQVVGSLKVNVKIKCAPVALYCTEIGVGTSTIAMESATKGSTIYYTIDGSLPNPDTSPVYTGPVVAGIQADIKAIAVKNGYKKSKVSEDIVGRISMRLEDFDFSNPIYSQTSEGFNHMILLNGGTALVLDENLTKAACVRAAELYVNYSNTRPNGAGYESTIREYCGEVDYTAEFITTFFEAPEEVARHILTNSSNMSLFTNKSYNFKKIGVGYYETAGRRFWSILVTT